MSTDIEIWNSLCIFADGNHASLLGDADDWAFRWKLSFY